MASFSEKHWNEVKQALSYGLEQGLTQGEIAKFMNHHKIKTTQGKKATRIFVVNCLAKMRKEDSDAQFIADAKDNAKKSEWTVVHNGVKTTANPYTGEKLNDLESELAQAFTEEEIHAPIVKTVEEAMVKPFDNGADQFLVAVIDRSKCVLDSNMTDAQKVFVLQAII